MNNLNNEKRVKQLRRRMRDIDWIWLSACMGVVEGDSNPVEAYLNSGGDPTRKLSSGEAQLLGRPGQRWKRDSLLVLEGHCNQIRARIFPLIFTFPTPLTNLVPHFKFCSVSFDIL